MANEEGALSKEFDHLALVVDLEDRWLADVGPGDNFLEPLRAVTQIEQQDVAGTFRFIDDGGRWRLERRQPEDSWRHRAFLGEFHYLVISRTEFFPVPGRRASASHRGRGGAVLLLAGSFCMYRRSCF